MMKIRGLYRIVFIISLMFFCVVRGEAQTGVIDLIAAGNKNIQGNQTGTVGAQLSMASSLLYGMPFELSLDVAISNTTAESAPSCNSWGSAILTTGTSPFDTPKNGIQIYLRCKNNAAGAYLVITANGQAFNFTNIPYNTDKFHISLIQSNGQLTMEVTNNATSTGFVEDSKKTVRYTKTMIFNKIDHLSYAMPVGMNVSNLSLAVRTEDINNYINNIMPLSPGYLTEETREYFVSNFSGDGEKLSFYQSFINAAISGGDVNGKRSFILPDPGKVYRIGNYIKNGDVHNYLTLWENKANNTADLVIKDAYNEADWIDEHGDPKVDSEGNNLLMQNLFSYLWIPRTNGNDNVMSFYHATGLGYYLDYSKGVSNSNPTSWTVEFGLEQGQLALRNNAASRYVAANSSKNAFGAWGTGGMYAGSKAQASNWSTDFFFEEVEGFVPYDLNIIGLTNSDTYVEGGTAVVPSTAKIRYQVQTDNYVDITNGGVILVGEGNENNILSDIKTIDVTNKIAVVTLGNGIITVEYTDFNTRKEKAEAELTAANTRLTNFSQGALYTSEAISAARTAINKAAILVSSNPKQACSDLEAAMETFYKTIDGRFVTMTNQSSKLISTTSHTNLYLKEKSATDESVNYFGVYQLHYISGGAYQLRNAYVDNYVGQTTSAGTVNSASNTVASRWRGTYTFNLVKTDTSEDAYNLVCTNGASNTMLGAATNVAKVDVNETNKRAATNLWDVRLVDVKTYANAYKDAISGAAFDNVIGHAPSTAVKDALIAAIDVCPDPPMPDVVNPNPGPTPEQETTLAGAVNHYIDHKDDINKPANGQYVTFTNRSATKYIGENLYEMKAADAIDLGCVWKTVVEGDKYYFQNAKTGMFMGKVTQSAVGRLTTKNNGANKQEIDIIAAPERTAEEGYVALHEMGTNNYRSYIHYSSDRNAIVGWSTDSQATHWTINAVADVDLIGNYSGNNGYFRTAAENLVNVLKADATDYPTDHSGYYGKITTDVDSLKNLSYTWPSNITTVDGAKTEYERVIDSFNKFTNSGTPISDNSMLLIKTQIVKTAAASDNYYVTQVLEDSNGSMDENKTYGSMTNGLPNNADQFLLFSLWQLVKDGEYYKLYNFYTRHYLSKDISLSDEARGRYGLTTDPDDAATFIIKPEHGCYVSLQRSDYEEMNNGFLNFSSFAGLAMRVDNGLTNGYSPLVSDAESAKRTMFSLEPATTAHLEKCLKSLLDYPIGDGIGKYTDVNADKDNSYSNEVARLKELFGKHEHETITQQEYETKLKEEAQQMAPTLADLRINLPQAGHYYRIYNIADSKRWYFTSAATGNNPDMTQATGESEVHDAPATVFYFDGEHLLAYGNGYYIGNGSTPWVMGGVGQNYLFKFANTGYTGKGCYSIKPQGRSYLYNNKTSGLNGWGSAFNAGCEWYLEEVTDLPLVVSAAGYATLVSGRTHRIPQGVDCYVAENASIEGQTGAGGAVMMERITDGVLPANVPVLVKANQGTYYFTEPSSLDGLKTAADYQSNIFVGDLETVYSGYTTKGGVKNYRQYTLQKPEGKDTGFYLYTGSTLRGFSANLPIENVAVPAQGAKPTAITFRFREDTPTDIGVKELERSNTSTAVYDLMGRRVTTPARGLYLARGKKIVIKH